jgi:hypothetical protein
MKDLVREKDEIIHHYSNPDAPTSDRHIESKEPFSFEKVISRVRIEYLSKQASQISHHDSTKTLEMYTRKL